jgi:hypothetical protein
MKRNAFLACALVSALVSQRLWAQGVGASGDIKGTVVDSSGAIMPRANIIATETAKGTRRVASTDGSGSFLITGPSVGSPNRCNSVPHVPQLYAIPRRVSPYGVSMSPPEPSATPQYASSRPASTPYVS